MNRSSPDNNDRSDSRGTVARLKARSRRVLEWSRRAVSQPRHELTQWQYATRYFYDLFRHGTKQLIQDRAAQMAGALAFRTLFGLLPVLVVGTLLVRAFVGPDDFRNRVTEYINAGVREFHIVQSEKADEEQQAESEDGETTSPSTVEQQVDDGSETTSSDQEPQQEKSTDKTGDKSPDQQMSQEQIDAAAEAAKDKPDDEAKENLPIPDDAAAFVARERAERRIARTGVALTSEEFDESVEAVIEAEQAGGPPLNEKKIRTIVLSIREGDQVSQTVEQIVNVIAGLNLSALGWAGVVVLIYSAISLMVTIENSFNTIYRAPEGRSWTRRITLYWFVLTAAPLLLALVAYVNGTFNAVVEILPSWTWLAAVASAVWSTLAMWAILFGIYSLVPNTSVRFRGALIGSLVAAVILEIGRLTFGLYMNNAVTFRQLYGSLGLIPLFMFGVYLLWLVVLFGLEVAATIQTLGGKTLEEIEQKQPRTGLVDPAAVIAVMQWIAEQFDTGVPVTARSIADEIDLPEQTVSLMLERLIAGGYLYRLEQPEGSITLARPAEQIRAEELLRIGHEMEEGSTIENRSSFLQQLRDAERKIASELTLAKLTSQPVTVSGEVEE